MSGRIKYMAAALLLLFAGCATAPRDVDMRQAAPEPAEGEVAVFGSIRLVEEINIFLPNEDQAGTVYLVPEVGGQTIAISCYDGGDFGVYLPTGRYKVARVSVDDYEFEPDIHLVVPRGGYKAVYAGVIELDGTPSGVDPDTGETMFVYSVKDESKQFADALRKESPGSEQQVYKSLFQMDGAIAKGEYPTKVFRAKDIENSLHARTFAVEEAIQGGIVTLTYMINPVWLLTIH